MVSADRIGHGYRTDTSDTVTGLAHRTLLSDWHSGHIEQYRLGYIYDYSVYKADKIYKLHCKFSKQRTRKCKFEYTVLLQ